MPPDMDGFTLCQKNSRVPFVVPFLMLSAKVEDMDKIMGLTLVQMIILLNHSSPLELVGQGKDPVAPVHTL